MKYHEHMEQARNRYVLAVLEEAGGCVAKAARLAGIHRSHMHKLVIAAGIRERREYGNSAWRESRV